MSNRPKILITIDWFLPGTQSGGPVRSYANLIAHLGSDFEFLVITRNTDYGSKTPYEGITPNTWVRLNTATQVYYISNDQLTVSHLKALYHSIDFDVALVNGIYSWYFSIVPLCLLKKTGKPVIVSARGMLNPQAFSVKPLKKRVFLALAMIFNLYKSVQFHATNSIESKHIKAKLGDATIVLIAPNLPRKNETLKPLKPSKNNPIRFVNIARIAVEKGTLIFLNALLNLDFTAEVDLYGPIYDTSYWEECKDVINKLPSHITVNYKGAIDSELVPKTLSTYDIFVMLSEGENFGHAILEALSVGLPVLISNRTPWQALEAKQVGWDVDITNQNAIISALQKAANMPDETYNLWSKAAYDYAQSVINDPEVLAQNRALFLEQDL